MYGLSAFVSAQNQYSLLDRRIERELTEASTAYGISVLPYFPLASGLLTGKYRRGQEAPAGTRLALQGRGGARFLNDRNLETVEKLRDFAEARGHTLLELAISWLVSRPYVPSVIAGATSPEQIEANVKASTWKLSADDLKTIDELTKRG